MKERTLNTAKRFGILDRIEKLEADLLKIDRINRVEFDLDGFYDDLNQVIFVTEYDIPVTLDNYFEVRKQLINDVLRVAKENGLNRTEDRIEDYGAHFYFVTSCGNIRR